MCHYSMSNYHFNVYKNKQHILYIVMEETTKFTPHVSWIVFFWGQIFIAQQKKEKKKLVNPTKGVLNF